MGARSPHKKEGREASPGKVSKQSRGTIRWMVPRNAFADRETRGKTFLLPLNGAADQSF